MSRRVEPTELTPLLSELVRVVLPHFSLEHEGEEAVLGKDRHPAHVEARSVCWYVARQKTDLSFPEIARCFRRHEHTSVMSGVRKIEKVLQHEKGSHLARIVTAVMASFSPARFQPGISNGVREVNLDAAPLARIELDLECERIGAVA